MLLFWLGMCVVARQSGGCCRHQGRSRRHRRECGGGSSHLGLLRESVFETVFPWDWSFSYHCPAVCSHWAKSKGLSRHHCKSPVAIVSVVRKSRFWVGWQVWTSTRHLGPLSTHHPILLPLWWCLAWALEHGLFGLIWKQNWLPQAPTCMVWVCVHCHCWHTYSI